MVYSFELIKHANIRYRESLPSLAQCELFSMLFSKNLDSDTLWLYNAKWFSDVKEISAGHCIERGEG